MLAEIFEAILSLFDPKTRRGKIVWAILAAIALAVAVIELLGAAGY